MLALLHAVPRPCSRPPPTHASAGDSWTLTGKSGSVSCGVTPPFSWILVHTHKVLFVSSKNLFPQLCVSSKLYDGINGNLLQKGLCHTRVCYIQSPCHCGRPLPTHTSAGDSWTLTGKSESVSCGVTAPFSWVQVRTRFCLCPPRVSFPSPV